MTGDTIRVGKPGQRSRASARKWGIGGFVVGLLISAATFSDSTLIWWISVASGAVAYWIAAARLTPRVRPSPADRRRNRELHALVTKKVQLGDLQRTAATDGNAKHTLVAQLMRLVEKMRDVDERLYAGRIARLVAACRLLEEQAEIDRALVSGYAKAMAMIDIEVESLGAAGEVTEAATASIDAKIAELDALREGIGERERLLTANEELEAFLGANHGLVARAPSDAEQSDDYAPPIPLENLFDDLPEKES